MSRTSPQHFQEVSLIHTALLYFFNNFHSADNWKIIRIISGTLPAFHTLLAIIVFGQFYVTFNEYSCVLSQTEVL